MASSRVGARMKPRGWLARRLIQQPGHHGDQKCGRFAGTRLGLAGNILAGQRQRQCGRLNRCTLFEATLKDASHQRFGQLEIGKCGVRKVSFAHDNGA